MDEDLVIVLIQILLCLHLLMEKSLEVFGLEGQPIEASDFGLGKAHGGGW